VLLSPSPAAGIVTGLPQPREPV